MSISLFEVNDNKKQFAIILGMGLIGRQIFQRLLKLNSNKVYSTSNKTNWDDSKKIILDLSHILSIWNIKKLDVIWSAGKAGFNSDDKMMEAEFNVFTSVINYLNTKNTNLTVNLLSSAGGIYEGSNYINSINDISPLRPYGIWKLHQENFLFENKINTRISRLSSVFGHNMGTGRLGLINVIIEQSRKNKIINIFANQNTLRDYILHTDIADHVINNIIDNNAPGIEILASGRAISINMLLNMIRNITHCPIRAIYNDTKDNCNNIVFNPNILPPNFRVTNLEEGILSVNSLFSSY